MTTTTHYRPGGFIGEAPERAADGPPVPGYLPGGHLRLAQTSGGTVGYLDESGAFWTQDERDGRWSLSSGEGDELTRAPAPSPSTPSTPIERFAGRFVGGVEVEGRVIAFGDTTRWSFRDGGTTSVRERVAGDAEIEFDEPELTITHAKNERGERTVIGQFITAWRGDDGWYARWRLANDLTPEIRAHLARPRGCDLSIGGDLERGGTDEHSSHDLDVFARSMGWAPDGGPEYRVRTLHDLRIGHVAVVDDEAGAYPRSVLFGAADLTR